MESGDTVTGVREVIARLMWAATVQSVWTDVQWGDLDPELREATLRKADAVLAALTDRTTP